MPRVTLKETQAECQRLQAECQRLQAELDAIKRCFDLNQAQDIAKKLVASSYGKDQAEVLAQFISELCWVDVSPDDL